MKVSDATLISGWASSTASSHQVTAEIGNTAGGQVEEATWDSSATALFDPLRQSCRNALIAECQKLVPDAADADDLLKFFLMDISMGNCLKTSRIKQAISATQILVQRSFLGLEKDITAAVFDTELSVKLPGSGGDGKVVAAVTAVAEAFTGLQILIAHTLTPPPT